MSVRGYTLEKDAYLRRLRKIEGQVRGLQRLIDEDTFCIDVLPQIASVRSALDQVALGLVEQHLHHCVIDAMTAEPKEQPAPRRGNPRRQTAASDVRGVISDEDT